MKHCFTFIFFLSLSISVQAVTIVENIANPQDASVTLTPGDASAQAFTTDSTLNLLDSVTVSLYKDHADTIELEVKIWAGSGDSPTQVIEDLGVQSIQPMGVHEQTFQSTDQPHLEPNTQYWISVTSVSGSFDWDITNTAAPSMSSLGDFVDLNRESSNGGVSWPNSGPAGEYYKLRVTGTPLSLITVMNTDDSGPGSLRKAIEDSAPGMGVAEIRFDPTAFEQRKTIRLDGTELAIDKDLTIDASDLPNGVIISGDKGGNGFGPEDSRVFTVENDKIVVMKSLTITGGKAPDGLDGGADENGGKATSGGGIMNSGDLTMLDCTVTQNQAGDGGNGDGIGNGGLGGVGGGIYCAGATLKMVRCTVSNNRAGHGGDGGTGGNGHDGSPAGGIYISGTLTLLQSTISGNHAGNGGDGDVGGNGGNGGGIGNVDDLVVKQSTITNNQSGDAGNGGTAGTGGGISDQDGTDRYEVSLENSIVAGNRLGMNGDGSVPLFGPDLESDDDTTRSGGNLIGDNTLGDGSVSTVFPSPDPSIPLNSEGDYVGTSATPFDPLLGPLTNNGGPTETHLPLRDSLAVDPFDGATEITEFATDQRGSNRLVGESIDIGAVEAPDYAVIDAQNAANARAAAAAQASARSAQLADLSRKLKKLKKKLKGAKKKKQVAKAKKLKGQIKKLTAQMREL